MLATSYREESDERNLHTGQSAQREPGAVAHVKSWAISAHANKNKRMKREQVGDEDVATPSRHHVAVEQSSQSAPHGRSVLDCLDPQIEGEDQEENRYSFIVIAPGH